MLPAQMSACALWQRPGTKAFRLLRDRVLEEPLARCFGNWLGKCDMSVSSAEKLTNILTTAPSSFSPVSAPWPAEILAQSQGRMAQGSGRVSGEDWKLGERNHQSSGWVLILLIVHARQAPSELHPQTPYVCPRVCACALVQVLQSVQACLPHLFRLPCLFFLGQLIPKTPWSPACILCRSRSNK